MSAGPGESVGTTGTARRVVVERAGVALVELLDGDRDWLRANDDGAFDPDPDDRPLLRDVRSFALGVLDTATGELLGNVSWHPVDYGRTLACAAWNIGIGLLPGARGRGVGSLAQRLLAEHLFATTELDRIEASTEVDNQAERKALRRAGFRVEGLIRGASMRGGVRRDYVSFSVLRGELRPATGERVILVRRDGVGLAEPRGDDEERLYAGAASEFDLDKDDRPRPLPFGRLETLVVVDAETGTPLGSVMWHPVHYGGTLGSTAWNIGIGLLPEARGRGVGTLAQRLLAERLFASTEVDRIEASTDVDNGAEQRALEKAGFRREGVLRGAQVRGGVRRDIVLYGLLRSDG